MTQEQISKLVEEYRLCRDAKTRCISLGEKRYYSGKMEGIKFALEVSGVYVKEVAMLL